MLETIDSARDERRQAALAMLTARGAAELAHPGGTLLAHLQRTARTLDHWGGSAALIDAGLWHAAYGTQGFPTALFALSERAQLRARIGDEAEAIVYAYCAWDRQRATVNGELRDRFSGEYWIASRKLRAELAELTAANELDVVEQCSASDTVDGVVTLLAAVSTDLSAASWSALCAQPRLRALAERAQPPHADDAIAYRELGADGPRLLLWHGGAVPELTWSRQHPLAAQLRLRIPWRRGYAPSAPTMRQDWALDARDLLRVLPERAHVVAHSYGAVGALVAASLAPSRFGSLTVIEPPVWTVAADDPEVQQLAALGRAFANGAPEAREAFLALAALPLDHEQTARTERIARGFRDPGEARPALASLRASALPVAVVSGAHNPALERMFDTLAQELGAQRWVLPGAGHAVQRQPDFNSRLLASIGTHGLAACE